MVLNEMYHNGGGSNILLYIKKNMSLNVVPKRMEICAIIQKRNAIASYVNVIIYLCIYIYIIYRLEERKAG